MIADTRAPLTFLFFNPSRRRNAGSSTWENPMEKPLPVLPGHFVNPTGLLALLQKQQPERPLFSYERC